MRETPLARLHEARGVSWREDPGARIPAVYSSLACEYAALQEGAGLVDLSHQTVLRITGRDRRSWLHGQVTQEINQLPDHRAAYAAILTPQGKMVSDLWVLALPGELLLILPPDSSTSITDYLNRFLIMERAEIEELTDDAVVLALVGPGSPGALASVLGDGAQGMAVGEARKFPFQGMDVTTARIQRWGEDGYDLVAPASLAGSLWCRLSRHRAEFAVESVGWDALNLRRIEAGTPAWGEELDESVGPLEAGLRHAISFHKGCYVGQEIIARIDARGQVNTLLTGFKLATGTGIQPGDSLLAEGRPVGRIRSIAHSLRLGQGIALGYCRREHREPGTRLETGGATPGEVAVAELPFLPHDYASGESRNSRAQT